MLEALGRMSVSTAPSAFRIHADNRSLRDTLVELCQAEDYDGFVQMALVQLDLVFEQDPVAQARLEKLVQVLKEVDGLDWPAAPALRVGKAKALNLEAVFRDNAELAGRDFPCKVPSAERSAVRNARPGVGTGRAIGSRPLPLIPRIGDPRATGSGPI
jgi:hypothetical protein